MSQFTRSLSPYETQKQDAEFGKDIIKGVAQPDIDLWSQGKKAEAVGHSVFDISSLFLAAADASKVSDATKAAKGVEGAGDVKLRWQTPEEVVQGVTQTLIPSATQVEQQHQS